MMMMKSLIIIVLFIYSFIHLFHSFNRIYLKYSAFFILFFSQSTKKNEKSHLFGFEQIHIIV